MLGSGGMMGASDGGVSVGSNERGESPRACRWHYRKLSGGMMEGISGGMMGLSGGVESVRARCN